MADPNTKLPDDSITSKYAKSCGAILSIEGLVNRNVVEFKAFLTDFSQTFASTWNSEDVFGRMDPVATFRSTKRTISLGWNVPSEDLKDAKYNQKKVSILTKMLYPKYTAPADGKVSVKGAQYHTQTMSAPPLVKIKYANLIRDAAGGKTVTEAKANWPDGLLGYIDNLSIKPEMEMGYFTEGGSLFPKVWSLSLNFNVLHQHGVGHAADDKGNLGFLGGTSWPF